MQKIRVKIDEEGRLVLPPDTLSRYGLKPGAEVLIDQGTADLRLRKPVTDLSKVYIEPTNRCNLECRTCMRNVWDEPLGQMSSTTFTRIVEGLRLFFPPPAVFFGGLGEPLTHPDIVEMVGQAKRLGSNVELITNGTLLTKTLSEQLIEAGLDMLWVSLDGAKPESYADVRLGAALPEVLANLAEFRSARWANCGSNLYPDYFNRKPMMGIVFVAMKRNIHDLPSVLRLGSQLGATRFLVSNVLPHSPDMREEILYSRALTEMTYICSMFRLDLPKIDINETTGKSLYDAMRAGYGIRFAGGNLGEATDWCPFIEAGATVISWEGNLSPCLPLLHSHTSFVDNRERFSRRYVVGNLGERDLRGLWNEPGYVSFRERVQVFDFSYCTICGGCHLFPENEEDCFGNPFPVCGGCLWAQGIIQCP